MTGLSADRIAIGSYPYYRYSMDYFLDTASQLGFSKVELWAAAPQIDLMDLSPVFCRDLHSKLKARNLTVCAITPEQCNYPFNLAAQEVSLRQRSVDYYCTAVDLAAELQCPWVLITSGSGYYDMPKDPALRRSLDSIEKIARYAVAHDVRLVYETLTPMSSNLVNSPAQVREMIDQLPANSVFGLLDIGQMTVMGQTVAEYGAALGDKLAHVHLHDTHPSCHMALGDGNLDLERIIGEILALGYGGLFSLECNDARYRLDPRAADAKNAAWLRDHGIT